MPSAADVRVHGSIVGRVGIAEFLVELPIARTPARESPGGTAQALVAVEFSSGRAGSRLELPDGVNQR